MSGGTDLKSPLESITLQNSYTMDNCKCPSCLLSHKNDRLLQISYYFVYYQICVLLSNKYNHDHDL